MTLNKLKENSRKEFDKKFVKHKLFDKGVFGFEAEDIKAFLDTQIDKTYAQALEDVKKIVPKKSGTNIIERVFVGQGEQIGFNRAIDTITDGIKKLKGKK